MGKNIDNMKKSSTQRGQKRKTKHLGPKRVKNSRKDVCSPKQEIETRPEIESEENEDCINGVRVINGTESEEEKLKDPSYKLMKDAIARMVQKSQQDLAETLGTIADSQYRLNKTTSEQKQIAVTTQSVCVNTEKTVNSIEGTTKQILAKVSEMQLAPIEVDMIVKGVVKALKDNPEVKNGNSQPTINQLKCNIDGCEKICNSVRNLNKHKKNIHNPMANFKPFLMYCSFENCNAKSRIPAVMMAHNKKHDKKRVNGAGHFVTKCHLEGCERIFRKNEDFYFHMKDHWDGTNDAGKEAIKNIIYNEARAIPSEDENYMITKGHQIQEDIYKKWSKIAFEGSLRLRK